MKYNLLFEDRWLKENQTCEEVVNRLHSCLIQNNTFGSNIIPYIIYVIDRSIFRLRVDVPLNIITYKP